MVRNEEKYDEAVRLRERGFTLAEIARYCDVSKSTVSKWLKNNAMSAVVTADNKKRAGVENAKRLRLINKARGPERAARYKEARRSAETDRDPRRRDGFPMGSKLELSRSGLTGSGAGRRGLGRSGHR